MTTTKTRTFTDYRDFIAHAEPGAHFRRVYDDVAISDYVATKVTEETGRRTLHLQATHTAHVAVMAYYMTTTNPLTAWIEDGRVHTRPAIGQGQLLGIRERVAEPSTSALFGAHQIATTA